MTVHLIRDFWAGCEREKDEFLERELTYVEALVRGSGWRVGVVGVDTTGREKT